MIGVGLKKLGGTPVPKLPSSYPPPGFHTGGYYTNWNIMGLEDPPTCGTTCGSLGALNKLFYMAKPQIQPQCYPVYPRVRS